MKKLNYDELTIVYLDYKTVSRKKIHELLKVGSSIFELPTFLTESY